MVEATTSKALNVRGEREVAVKLDPRQVTTDDTGTWTASNAIDWDWILASWCLEPNQIKSVLSVFILADLQSSSSQSLQCTPWNVEVVFHTTQLYHENKAVYRQRRSAPGGDDVGGIENKEKQSKDASLWYTTKDSWSNRLGSGETNGLRSPDNKWVDPVKYLTTQTKSYIKTVK